MPRQIHPKPFVIQPPADFVEKHPELRRLSHTLSIGFAGGVQKVEGMTTVVTEEALQVMGSSLWQALEVEENFEAARKEAGAAILPIVIQTDQADEQTLPWETLFHPELGFLGKHAGFTLSRRMGAPTDAPTSLEKGPMRVLLFTSLPDDVNPEHERLNVEEEQIQVQEALLPWISQGLVELEMPDDGRFSTLKEMLNSFHPHVLFLSGHGRFHDDIAHGEKFGVFLFEGEAGDSQPVREEAIAEALVGMGVRLVVLSACESGKSASDALNNGLMSRVSAQGIPHVIGMRESVLDVAGVQFARALCDELAKREQVDAALQFARGAIQTPLKDIARRETDTGAVAELSMGQWCLPMLLSPNAASPLIDWDFEPKKIQARYASQKLETISLPPRFVGRRAELRQYKSGLLNGTLRKLFLTGAGGHGKTTLAGKLALDLQKARGYRVFVWAARPENAWRDFEFQLELALDEANAKKYDRFRTRFENDGERAKFMLDLLAEQFEGKAALFLDNLETIQDPKTFEITDPTVSAWMRAAQNTRDLTLLCTSRWKLPDWDGEHLPLTHANYGDFLQMAQALTLDGKLERSFLADRARLRKVYETLGGNSRGLEFFAAATLHMESKEEDAFLQKLAQAKGDLQTNVAIEVVYKRLPEAAKAFLARLHVFQEPVPAEGMIKLGLDLAPDPQTLLERLLTVSLLEAQYEPTYDVLQYQCSPLVSDWLSEKKLLDNAPQWLNAAADYQVYLLEHERDTLPQAILAHNALRRAGRDPDADRLTLDFIVYPFTLRGLYATLLTDWLPPIFKSNDLKIRGDALGWYGRLLSDVGDYETALAYLKQSLAIMQGIGDKAGEGTTLNNISQIFKAQGDYETALAYLKQSLAIRQGIGDKAGLCATLFNMGHIYVQKDQIEDAVGAWVTAYVIAKQINYYEVLQALSKLAPQIGLPEGWEGWEALSKRMNDEE